jgi:hypothetical protein
MENLIGIVVVLCCTIVFHKHLNSETKKKEPGMEHDGRMGFKKVSHNFKGFGEIV